MPPLDVQKLDYEPLLTKSRLLNDALCDWKQIEALWAQKARIDVLFDAGNEKLYYRARETIFPSDNKAGPSNNGVRNKCVTL